MSNLYHIDTVAYPNFTINLRNDVKHLLECFCEIVSPETSNKQPWVVQKFPESFKDDEMLKQVALFAYPCDVPW